VLAVLTGVMLASLLLAAALPDAFGAHGVLFAISYVALQVGRNAAAASLLRRDEPLRDVFERLVGWSAASGLLWLAGAALPGDRRLLLWIPAVVLDLCAPVAGYWLPGRGRAVTTDYDIEGRHFTDRCQGFIIIALGESIVVTGATAADAGLSSTVVLCLCIAFLETAALWWLYFGAVAERSRQVMSSCEDPGRLARDAYLSARPDRVGDHRRRGGRRPADRRAGARAARRRAGDGARRAGPLPRGREPVPPARDRRGQRQAPRGCGDPRAARPAGLADQRAGAERGGGRAAERARALGVAHAGERPPGTGLGAPTVAPRALMRDLRHLQQRQEGTP
jgi:hypothetical protein